MSRLAARTAQHLIDLGILAFAFALAFAFRFDGLPSGQMLKRLLFLWPYAVLLQVVVLHLFGVPRFAWRYVGLREVQRIATAVAASSAVFLVARYVSGAVLPTWPGAQYALIPTSVILIDGGLAFMGIAGVRVLRRLWAERTGTRPSDAEPAAEVRTLLVGAGSAGVQVAREIAKSRLGMKAVGFVDDDPFKLGTVIHGLPVLGTTADLVPLAARHEAQQVLITIASASGRDIRRIVQLCDAAGLTAKIIPGISEILDGRVNLSRIREVSIEDLLGRDTVHLEEEVVQRFLHGRRVMVTGAGGSIGSELCRQVARLGPATLLLVERSEPSLFEIDSELRRDYPGLDVRPLLCDVADAERVDAVFADERPHVVFHAAAHKHVPMMERNPGEAVKNNVFGTRTLADAADRHGAEAFVMVSTDKAVNPTSVMGATKRCAEIYTQALGQRSKTKFVAVRFGNVLGSAGSVIPIFKRQIAAGGPVMVTHPEMRRYFMTIPEASQLVLQAGAMGHGGEIFVLDMGEPVRIVDLARDLIKLSGFEPDVDIRIAFSGARPGEKLFEELGFDAEKMDKTRHPMIYTGRLTPYAWPEVERGVAALQAALVLPTRDNVRVALRAMVPEMQDDVLMAQVKPGVPPVVTAPALDPVSPDLALAVPRS